MFIVAHSWHRICLSVQFEEESEPLHSSVLVARLIYILSAAGTMFRLQVSVFSNFNIIVY